MLRRFLAVSCSLLIPASIAASACGPDPKPLECTEPHPSFDVLIVAPDGQLPPDMVVRVAYGGSSVEEYRADMPAIRQVVFCEPALPDGGAPPLANDAGAGGQGGAGGEAGAPSGGGMGGEATASAGSGGGAELDAGGAALPGLRCELWTQGPATLEVEAREFEPVERTLRVSTSACTVMETIELQPLDGGTI